MDHPSDDTMLDALQKETLDYSLYESNRGNGRVSAGTLPRMST